MSSSKSHQQILVPQIPSRNNHVDGSNTVYHIWPHQFAILQSLGFEYLHFLLVQSLSQTIGHPQPPTPGCNFLALVLEITLLGMWRNLDIQHICSLSIAFGTPTQKVSPDTRKYCIQELELAFRPQKHPKSLSIAPQRYEHKHIQVPPLFMSQNHHVTGVNNAGWHTGKGDLRTHRAAAINKKCENWPKTDTPTIGTSWESAGASISMQIFGHIRTEICAEIPGSFREKRRRNGDRTRSDGFNYCISKQ